MEDTATLLKKFHVSPTTGFLLADPLVELPEYCNQWNFAAKEMSKLVTEKKMRKLVDKMDLLDHTKLSSYNEYMLAHLQISLIAAGYIWQEGEKEPVQVVNIRRGLQNIKTHIVPSGVNACLGPLRLLATSSTRRRSRMFFVEFSDYLSTEESLPECLAVPWYGVAEVLGMKPVISYYSINLANWKWSEEERRIKTNYRFPGGDEADWFISVTCQVEMDFGPAIPHIIDAIRNSNEGSIEALVDNLKSLTAVLKKMTETLSKYHDGLSATTFYDVIRPFMSGWGGKDSPLPDGLIYRGVDKQPKKMKGSSAAESSTLPCMDALLGVVHEKEAGGFLNWMRDYMPTAHRAFIGWIESNSNVKAFVEKQACTQLTSAFDDCVKSVMDFRTYHIQIATKYMVMMSNKSNTDNDFDSQSSKGTDLLRFLKTVRNSASTK